jgi:uncharacterized protein YoxC
MESILLGLITILLAIITASLILLLLELKRNFALMRKITEEKLYPLLEELRPLITDTRDICDNVNGVTSDVKRLSQAVGDVGKSISVVSGIIENVGSSAAIKAISFRAGIRAALDYLLTNLMRRGGRT